MDKTPGDLINLPASPGHIRSGTGESQMSQVAVLSFSLISLFLPVYHLRLLKGPLSPVRSLLLLLLSHFSHVRLCVTP